MSIQNKKVVSGIRSSGNLHIGHYHGILKNWIKLQNKYDCYFFVADLHSLTTCKNNKPFVIDNIVLEIIIDFLACGVDPNISKIFIQSMIPEHTELYLLLSMIVPISWLKRIPSFKEQEKKINPTYGFLGYPLLQSADILLYNADYVPIGIDQISHIELTKMIVRRFNFIYGEEKNFKSLIQECIQKIGIEKKQLYFNLKNKFQKNGCKKSLYEAKNIVIHNNNLSVDEKNRLLGYLYQYRKLILNEPEPIISQITIPGTNGKKMSKSYNNTISLREYDAQIEKKILVMPTDPNRITKRFPGNPDICTIWKFHIIYSTETLQKFIKSSCKSAEIGCIECKKIIINAIQNEIKPIQEKIQYYKNNINMIKDIIIENSKIVRKEAKKNLNVVKKVMGLI